MLGFKHMPAQHIRLTDAEAKQKVAAGPASFNVDGGLIPD
jgi:hypothetical protein